MQDLLLSGCATSGEFPNFSESVSSSVKQEHQCLPTGVVGAAKHEPLRNGWGHSIRTVLG